MTLKPRQEQVLRLVVEEYIASAAPVGSRRLTERYALGAAASTVRNDLAELEDLGMLAHPHTSAGRVPTDAGYRHYVDVLMSERGERGAVPASSITLTAHAARSTKPCARRPKPCRA